MTIRLVPNPRFSKEVPIPVPGTGTPPVANFVFRVLDRERVTSLLVVTQLLKKNWFVHKWEFLKLCYRARKYATAVDLLDEMIVSWEGFDLDYSKDALHRLITEYPSVVITITLAYFSGLQEDKLKN